MPPNFILYAIPVFFLMIGIEVAWCAYKKLPYYRFNDSINDLSMGITEQVLGGLLKLMGLGLYALTYEHLRVFDVSTTHPLAWVAAFLAYDLCYYWLHRASHHVNILWGGHAPHHSSEEYNLAVALRQGLFQSPLTFFFYLPLAFLGFHPLQMAAVGQLNTIYQFWIHTRVVGKLGFLETFLNTPSHHRVHHGKNLRYIDMNHAGMFIIWDKMFGTFVEEQEEPVYGTIEPLASWNPMWGQTKFFFYLFGEARKSKHWYDVLRIWFMPAGWTPEHGKKPYLPDETSSAFLARYNPPVPPGLSRYVFTQFVLATALAVVFLIQLKQIPLADSVLMAGLVTLSLTTLGAMMESRRWSFAVELVRLAALPPITFYYLGTNSALFATGLALISALWFFPYRAELKNPAFVTVQG